jgi:hypothetical protein
MMRRRRKREREISVLYSSSYEMPNFRVFVGTYERLLIALDVNHTNNEYSMTLSVGYATHIGCIKALAVSSNGRYLATGSSDEKIKCKNSL